MAGDIGVDLLNLLRCLVYFNIIKMAIRGEVFVGFQFSLRLFVGAYQDGDATTALFIVQWKEKKIALVVLRFAISS